MNKSLKYRVVNTLIMNIPVAFAIAITAQLLSIHKVVLPLLVVNFALAYVISFCVGMLIPAVSWGIAFAGKCKAEPGTLPFGLCVNLIVNLVYVVINSLILTYFNVIILGKAPMIAYFIGIVSTFVPIYIVGYIVSFLWNKPTELLSSRICGEQ